MRAVTNLHREILTKVLSAIETVDIDVYMLFMQRNERQKKWIKEEKKIERKPIEQ